MISVNGQIHNIISTRIFHLLLNSRSIFEIKDTFFFFFFLVKSFQNSLFGCFNII